MMKNYKFTLQKYKGPGTRHECPCCGDKHSFVYYVDAQGNYISPEVGRCNHESRCGYHMTPSEYFKNNPRYTPCYKSIRPHIPVNKPVERPSCYIPMKYVVNMHSEKSDFVHFLQTLTDDKSIKTAFDRYALGATKTGDVIFWQIDKNSHVRAGKIMKYNPKTGHRIKDGKDIVNWVHSKLKREKLLPDNWELSQCLFGEHLATLDLDKNKPIVIVESEKTAIIGSIYLPNYIWMATGGICNLNEVKLSPIKDRNIIIVPDVDGYDKWRDIVSKFRGYHITVSDILEKEATEEERNAQIDIGDWMIQLLQKEKEHHISHSDVINEVYHEGFITSLTNNEFNKIQDEKHKPNTNQG